MGTRSARHFAALTRWAGKVHPPQTLPAVRLSLAKAPYFSTPNIQQGSRCRRLELLQAVVLFFLPSFPSSLDIPCGILDIRTPERSHSLTPPSFGCSNAHKKRLVHSSCAQHLTPSPPTTSAIPNAPIKLPVRAWVINEMTIHHNDHRCYSGLPSSS